MLTRNRVFGALLIISWTLNVALGVALFYSKQPHFPPPPFGPPDEMVSDGPPEIPMEFRETLRKGIEPLMEEQRCIARELFHTLAADTLDTTRLQILSDSLSQMRCQIQKTMISQVSELHGKLSPEQRNKIYAKMMGRIHHEGGNRRFHFRDKP